MSNNNDNNMNMIEQQEGPTTRLLSLGATKFPQHELPLY